MALIDKASLLMVPSTYEAGKLYNVLPSGNRAPDSTDQNSGYDQTRADFDFDRGSNTAATRVNADGLIEKYRENKLLQSNNFSTWTSINTTETSGQADKDGGTDAWLISKSASGARVQQAISVTGVQTLSVYAKAGTLNWVALSNNLCYVYFDILNGTIGTEVSNIDASITSVGNGWFHCTMTYNGSATDARFYPSKSDNDSTGTSGNIYIQNAQLESGLVSTDYLESTSVTGKAGVLVDLPRINFDANGENGSLLLEPSRQNVMPYSEYFEAWDTTGSITLTTNYGISPEGLKNSTRVQFSGASQELKDATSVVAGNVASIYIKGTDGETIKFGSALAEEIMTLNGEWQRLETYNAAATNKITINTYSGATARDIEIYGAMLEAGSYASSYIPTMGTTETRAADDCSVTGASDVIGQTEGTMFLDFIFDSEDGSLDFRFQLSNGASASYWIFIGIANGFLRAYVRNVNVVQFDTGDVSATIGTRYKIALAYAENDFAVYINGSQETTSSSGTIPATNAVSLGNAPFDTRSVLKERVKQATLFKERLSNAELATLTTL